MVANYTSGVTSGEENYLLYIDDFLVNHVGWYRIDTISDTGTNRDYVYMSDGEPDQYANTNVRYIRLRATGNVLYLYTYETYIDSSTNTGEVFETTYGSVRDVSSDIYFQLTGDKERLILTHRSSDTLDSVHPPAYLGRVQSLYSAGQHPYPNMVKGSYQTISYWANTGSTSTRAYAISPTGVQRYYWILSLDYMTDASSPSHRNSRYLALPVSIFSPETPSDYDILGQARGVYQVSKYIPRDAYITLASGTHKVWCDGNKNYTHAFGPLTDSRVGEVNRIPPSVAEVDYNYRGLETDINTLANWRMDSESLGVYEDQTGVYDLTPVNSPTLAVSPLVNAVSFNGTTQSATNSGTGADTYLTGEWTCEVMIYPDSIPGSGKSTVIEFGTNSDGTEAENILLSISIAPSGNVNVLWERDIAGTDESNTTSGDFLLVDRWNYLAIVKKDVGGSNYDIQVWHSSFGDHNPVLRETFSSVSNSTGGADSSWFIGTDSSLSDFYEGRIDAIRVQKEALSESQIKASLYRVRL